MRLGFSFEGTFRQHQIVRGRNLDTAWVRDAGHRLAAFEAVPFDPGCRDSLASLNAPRLRTPPPND